MQCDEKGEICLNYMTSVPEWQTPLMLDAVAKLGAAMSACGTVQKAIVGDMAWSKMHPDSTYMGTIPIDRIKACEEAARTLGSAVYALEILLAQSDLFGYAKQLAHSADTAYNIEHAELEALCRKRGCREVGYSHG